MRFPLPDIDIQEIKNVLPGSSPDAVPATYQMPDDSMSEAHIPAGATLLINPEIKPRTGMIVLGLLNGQKIVRRLARTSRCRVLHPENRNYKPVPVTADTDFRICGVVTSVIINVIKEI